MTRSPSSRAFCSKAFKSQTANPMPASDSSRTGSHWRNPQMPREG